MFNKKTILGSLVIFGALLLVATTVGAVLYPDSFQKKYSAVFTINNEFYVGKLFRWPFSSTIQLRDAFILQNVRSSATEEGNLQLIPLANSLWEPGVIRFNRDNVVFTGAVGENSQIAQTIRGYKSGALPPATSEGQQ